MGNVFSFVDKKQNYKFLLWKLANNFILNIKKKVENWLFGLRIVSLVYVGVFYQRFKPHLKYKFYLTCLFKVENYFFWWFYMSQL